MNNYTYTGYPMRDVIPRGYCFFQFVVNFREAGGYAGLVPRKTAPIAPPATPQSHGTQPVEGARSLTDIAQTGKAVEQAMMDKDTAHEGGEFDAVESEARAEFKWRGVHRP